MSQLLKIHNINERPQSFTLASDHARWILGKLKEEPSFYHIWHGLGYFYKHTHTKQAHLHSSSISRGDLLLALDFLRHHNRQKILCLPGCSSIHTYVYIPKASNDDSSTSGKSLLLSYLRAICQDVWERPIMKSLLTTFPCWRTFIISKLPFLFQRLLLVT